ncbi:hypothetical protein C8T65DRAFT_639365 [Cerioporus squamosus]|nr:hypothetical protein C8T65DRAFT_639365 [Cerioporus squamosus]
MNMYERAKSFVTETERAHEDSDLSIDKLHEIAAFLQAAQYNVRSAINARAPINRILLPELITAIFALVPDPVFPEDDDVQAVCGPYLLRATSDLRPVTLVCKLWRSLGLSTLWTSVSCAYGLKARFTSQPLHVSRLPPDCVGAGPLYVGADAPDYYDRIACAFLSKHGHQVEELHVKVDVGHLDNALAAGNPPPASLSFSPTSLRRLHMRGAGQRVDWRDMALFGGSRLNLSSLAMWDIPFLPTNALGSSLTRLIIYYRVSRRDGQAQNAIPVRDLLRFLSENRALEQVYLEGFTADQTVETLPIASMPRVRKLSITIGPGTDQLLSRLRLPDTCLVRLGEGKLNAQRNKALRTVITVLGWRGTKAHVMWVGGSPDTSGGRISLQVLNGSAGGLRVDLSWSRTRADAEVSQQIRSFLSTPPFVTVEELWLSGTGVAGLLRRSGRAISPLSALATLHILNLQSMNYQTAGLLWPDAASQEITMDNIPSLTCLHYCLPRREHLLDLVTLLDARASANHPITSLFVSTTPFEDDPSPNSDWAIARMTESFVDEVLVGEDLCNRLGSAWWSVVPRECTAVEEVHGLWPVWAEGMTDRSHWQGLPIRSLVNRM